MDKKIYKKPEIEEYEIGLVSMLCASDDFDPDKPQVLPGEGGTDDIG